MSGQTLPQAQFAKVLDVPVKVAYARAVVGRKLRLADIVRRRLLDPQAFWNLIRRLG